jgi:hypothetical protein
MITIVTDDEELWGQFTDIEHGYSFQEQKIVFFSKPKIKQIPLPIPILKPVLKQCIKTLPYKIEPCYKNIDKKDDFYNPALDKIIERQIYLGCVICLLTVGLFILP